MSAEVTSEILQPAKHGWVVDLQQGAARYHVRVFAFEEQDYQHTRMEMPVPLEKPAAITALRQAMEALRESMHGAGVVALPVPQPPVDEETQVLMPLRMAPAGIPIDAPVLLLDVDGVVNTRVGNLDMDKLARVGTIVKETGCVVVIISSWRYIPHQMVRLMDAMHRACDGGVIMQTPTAPKPVLTGASNYIVVAATKAQEIEWFFLGHPHLAQRRSSRVNEEAMPEHYPKNQPGQGGTNKTSQPAINPHETR